VTASPVEEENMSEQRAVLLTDLVDSTRLVAQLGDAAASQLWEAHDRVARDLLRRWHGREIDKSDGFLLLFEAVADAAAYALEYHRALAALPEPLHARAGLHVGEVTLRENPPDDVALGAKPLEVDGLAKALAARVMALARGGQTLLTAQACALLGRPASSVGHWRLKGMDEPLPLYVLDDATASIDPPADSDKGYRVTQRDGLWVPLREVRHGLPAERDAFIGRQPALASLAAKFRQDHGRLVSVVGVGGTGKTRLALRHAWTQLGEYAGGAWFCDLSQARDIDGLLLAVSQGLGVPLGRVDPTEQLGAALAGRAHCLVLLDNCEQVAREVGDTLGHWLERAPQVHFVATSREALGIAGEQVLMLEPMSRPEGVALFCLRSTAAGEKVPPSDPDVDKLVRLLDGLPLAIELAAARVRVMSVRQLLGRMSERLNLLSASRGRIDRQATLRAAFDWSWDLLSSAERIALAQLSVFEGRITLRAAEAALDLSVADAPLSVTDALQSLAEKSLLLHRSDDTFAMLASVQAYADEQLRVAKRRAESGLMVQLQTQRRHAAYFAGLGAARAIDDRCGDLDNLITATRRAAAMGEGALAVDALEGAWAALRLRGPYRLGIELTRMVREIAGLDARARARVGRMQGWVLEACGQVGPAAQAFEEALASARQAGDTRCEAQVLAHLGDQHANMGESERAREEFEAALALARDASDTVIAAHSGLGNLHAFQGRFADARREFDAALAAARAVGDRRWEGGSLGNLGLNCYYQGHMAEAEAFYDQALAIARELGDRQREGNTLCNIGILYWTQGRNADARSALDAALEVARDMGHARLECVVLCNLGLVVEGLAAPDEAHDHFEAALRVATDLADRRSQGQVLGYLGILHARQGRYAHARTCLDDGERLLVEVGDRSSLGVLTCGRAEALWLAGDAAGARRAHEDAIALAGEVEAELESEFGQALARVRQLLGDSTSA